MNNKISKGVEILVEQGPVQFIRSTGEYISGKVPPKYRFSVASRYNFVSNKLIYGQSPVPGKLIEVKPQNITYVTPVSKETDVNNKNSETVSNCIFDIPYGYFQPEKRVGKIVSGNWDRKEVLFEDLFIYKSFKSHFCHDVPWEDTEYFSRVDQFFKKHGGFKNTDSITEFKNERLSFYDELYQEINQGRYARQADVSGGYIFNEITVNITRDGEVFFNSGGAHRLSIAKIAGIEAIPVLPIVFHEKQLYKIRGK